MKGKPISFFSEHTAEYLIIPRLVGILRQTFHTVIPLYFWATREGNRMSVRSGPERLVRLMAVYPRRPKIECPRADALSVRFNPELFQATCVAQQRGVPVIAGLPIANSIEKLTSDCPVAWFRLIPPEEEDCDVELRIETGKPLSTSVSHQKALEGPLDDEGIRHLSLSACRQMSWIEAVEAMKEIRKRWQANHLRRGHVTSYYYFGTCRPSYMILLGKREGRDCALGSS